MKRISLLLLTIFMACALSACKYEAIYDMSDGENVKTSVAMYIEKDALDDYYEKNGAKKTEDVEKMEIVTIDGVSYYKDAGEPKTQKISEVADGSIGKGVINSDMVYLIIDDADDLTNMGSSNNDTKDAFSDFTDSALVFKFIFIFKDEITDTNGELSEDKKTVTFEISSKEENANPQKTWYAYTDAAKARIEADTEAPKISGLKKNTWYSSLEDLKITDNTSVTSVTFNGTEISGSKMKSGKWLWSIPSKVKIKKNNVIVATDANGNKSSITFKYEKKAPVVKKLKNYSKFNKTAKFYVKDKDSGINKVTYKQYGKKKEKKATLKKVKSGKYKGYYEASFSGKKSTSYQVFVYDKAGNKSEFWGVGFQK
ncbi:MAG: hypothetical protein IKQ71_05550 [Lachnospiraceae bacterium]|nr:hypothetical protein [Lachnospiraceae bacterium]